MTEEPLGGMTVNERLWAVGEANCRLVSGVAYMKRFRLLSRAERLLPCLACAMLVALLAVPTPARALDSQWHWIRVQPDEPGWLVLEGTTTVEFTGSTFRTALIQSAGNVFYHFEVSGSIDGNRVTATEEWYQTDADPVTFEGTI